MSLKVLEAAKIMDVSPQFIRFGLQQGRLPIGTAVQSSEFRWVYDIREHLVKQYMGEEAYNEAIKKIK